MQTISFIFVTIDYKFTIIRIGVHSLQSIKFYISQFLRFMTCFLRFVKIKSFSSRSERFDLCLLLNYDYLLQQQIVILIFMINYFSNRLCEFKALMKRFEAKYFAFSNFFFLFQQISFLFKEHIISIYVTILNLCIIRPYSSSIIRKYKKIAFQKGI